MLASDVVDEALSAWLWPAGVDRPAYDLLVNAMTSTAPASGDFFDVEGHIQGLIPPNTLLEIEEELILTRSAAATSVQVQDRGWLDTDPADHAAGTKVYLNPKYTRKTLLTALSSLIGQLYPRGRIYVKSIDETQTFSTRAVKTLPSGALGILSILVRENSNFESYHTLKMEGRDWLYYPQFTPPRFHLRRGGAEGQPVVIEYKKDFGRPQLPSDDLDTLGIPETLQPYLAMAVAGEVLSSKEIPRVQVEEIRRMLATTGIQIGQVMNIGQQMTRVFFSESVRAERLRLQQSSPTQFAWAGH